MMTKRKEKEMLQPFALTRKDAARALSLSLPTLDRAISRGHLVAKKYGSRTLITMSEIERYLEKLKDKEKPPAG